MKLKYHRLQAWDSVIPIIGTKGKTKTLISSKEDIILIYVNFYTIKHPSFKNKNFKPRRRQ